MKKQIAVFLSLAMAATACSPAFAGETEAQTEGQASGGAFIAGAETEADVTVPSDMKFGFIFLHDENSTYDLNFINGANSEDQCPGGSGVLRDSCGPCRPGMRGSLCGQLRT